MCSLWGSITNSMPGTFDRPLMPPSDFMSLSRSRLIITCSRLVSAHSAPSSSIFYMARLDWWSALFRLRGGREALERAFHGAEVGKRPAEPALRHVVLVRAARLL